MLVYTITVNIEHSVSEAWLTWMKVNFLDAIFHTGYFEQYKVFKVLHDSDGDTFSFQFYCRSNSEFGKFEAEHKHAILHELMESFPGKVVYFNTMLEELTL